VQHALAPLAREGVPAGQVHRALPVLQNEHGKKGTETDSERCHTLQNRARKQTTTAHQVER
jgi:hypothetical protein